MNYRFFAVFVCSVTCFLVSSGSAQVPGLVNYQGRVIVGSTNFNGTGQFRFALTNSSGSTFYWTNDGTGSPAGQPTNAVSLTVTNGLYSVLLGDTTLTNMTTIPASVFTNPDVRLRVWFDDGVPAHGSQVLSPDQRLAAAGYALMAGGVDLPATTSATSGVLTLGGAPFLHAFNGSSNVFLGTNAGNFTMTGGHNTASGSNALFRDSAGGSNTASGYNALTNNTSGGNNTASGDSALANSVDGTFNTAFGLSALHGNIHGSNNTGVGRNSGQNITGGNNTVLGNQAGYNLTGGSNNIDIGNYNPNTGVSSDVANESNIIRIGDGATQTDTYLTGIIHGNGSGLTGITGTSFANGLTLAGTTTISGDLALPNTTSASTGVLTLGGNPFLHDAGDVGSLFAGANAGNFTLTGTDNTASGYQTLFHDTTGSNDTASGFQALYRNTTGSNNTASGDSALFNNTTGSANTASGIDALFANTTGGLNTALGFFAGGHLTSGSNNIDIGNYNPNTQTSSDVAGESNIIRIGDGATQTDTYLTGIIHGNRVLALPATTSASTGVLNIGGSAFLHAYGNGGLTDGNTFVGASAGNFSLTGTSNTAAGYGALSSNTTGSSNVAVGSGTLSSNHSTATTNGINNTAVGTNAMFLNTTGSSNVALGYQAGNNLSTGSNNIDIGNFNPNTSQSSDVAGESNIIRIGDGATQTDTYLTGSVHANKVGIGIAASHGTLDVSGDTGAYTLSSTNAGFNGSSSGIVHFNAGTPASAIYANGGIVTTESFIAVSDARVKLVLGRSDAARDLDTLQAIAITDFRYKDVLAHGDAVHKKVIAQQVEQVFPQAVSRRVGEVPDIYQRATMGADGWIELATDLQVGERVKLIGAQSQGVYDVRAVEATRFRTDFQPAADDAVFVYGREVQDFRAVDYEAIAMLNVSATQELARQLTAAEQENAALKQRVTDLEAKDKERDARLVKLEQQTK